MRLYYEKVGGRSMNEDTALELIQALWDITEELKKIRELIN